MILTLNIENGIVTNKLPDLLNGEYLCLIVNTADKTIKGLRRQYFLLLGLLSNDTGYQKRDLHIMVKESQNVESTKSFDTSDWSKYIINLKLWAQASFDIVL